MKEKLHLFTGITLSAILCLVCMAACGSGSGNGDDECESPLIWDEEAGKCVEDPNNSCEDGQQWNEENQKCENIIPECTEGEELDTENNTCVSVCEEGYEWNTDLKYCIEDLPDCGPGKIFDKDINFCREINDEDRQRTYCSQYTFDDVKSEAGVDIIAMKPHWYYNGYTSNEKTSERLFIHFTSNSSSIQIGESVELTEDDKSFDSCKFCAVLYKNCVEEDDITTCDKFMPMGYGEYTITGFSSDEGEVYSGKLTDVIFREVTIDDDGKTVPIIPGGETLCMDTYEFSATTVGGPGYIYMDRPLDAGCEYPDGPYFFYGPQEGKTDVDAGTMPPMAWPGGYIDGQSVGFNLAEYRCEHPEVKTLFIVVGAGWCSACSSLFKGSICPAGGILDQVHAQNGEFLFVIGETGNEGTPADNYFADSYMNSKGCESGIRVSDLDNSCGRRAIYGNDMLKGYPWSAAIRLSDMKVIAVQPELYRLDYVGIATENNK